MMQAQDIWHDITEIKGKRILGRNPIFFNLDSLKLFCFITSYLNFLKTILGEREGFLGKHCVLCAIFQGVSRLLTAFWVLPERHQLWEEGLYLINKKRVRVRTNKRSSKSNPLISLPSCMPDHLGISSSPAAAAFKQLSSTPALVADLLWVQIQAWSFLIPSLHPFIPTDWRKWKMKVNCLLHSSLKLNRYQKLSGSGRWQLFSKTLPFFFFFLRNPLLLILSLLRVHREQGLFYHRMDCLPGNPNRHIEKCC